MAPENRPQMESSLPMLVSGRVYNKYQYTGHSEMISLWMLFDVEDVRFFMSQVILPTNQQVTPFDGWNFLEKRNRNCWPHDMEIKLAIFTSPQNYVNIQRQYGHFWRVFLDRRGISWKNDQTSWKKTHFPLASYLDWRRSRRCWIMCFNVAMERAVGVRLGEKTSRALREIRVLRVQQGRSTCKNTSGNECHRIKYQESVPRFIIGLPPQDSMMGRGFSWGFEKKHLEIRCFI